MAKINFNMNVPSIEAIEVEIREMITKAGRYAFEIVKAEMTNSRVKTDGSEKDNLPSYVDETPEVYLVLKDILTGRTHVHRMALASFRKFKEFTPADIKDNKIINDPRDGYALLKDGEGNLHRIPANEGDGYEAVLNIFSRFTTAIGMPVGTKPSDCEEFKGRFFKGELKENHYNAIDGTEKDRLKLSPSFYPLTKEELEQLQELAGVAQSFK